VETELTDVARRETKSILRERGYPGMSTLSFQRIFQEMSTLCPTVYSIISQMRQGRKAAAMALIYGMIMFNRCKESTMCYSRREMQVKR